MAPQFAVAEALPITRILDVMSTPRAQTALRPLVRVRGTVSLVGDGISSTPTTATARRSFCIEDESAGIWVRSGLALREELLQVSDAVLDKLEYGVDVELEGHVDKGAFAPVILPTKITIVGTSELPQAPRVLNRRFLNGGHEMRRVQVSGVIQNITDVHPGSWSLRIETGVGHFLARVPKEPIFSPERLLDAEVEIIGLAAVAWNWRSEFVCPRLIINRREDFKILKAASPDPFQVKKVTIENLDGYAVNGRPLHRRRIEGTVTYYDQDRSMYLQDNGTGVRVQIDQPVSIQVGDRVEASGFIDKSQYLAGLRGASVRTLGKIQNVEPFETTVEEIISQHEAFLETPPSSSSSCDGRLVKLSGRLLDFHVGHRSMPHRLQIDCGDSIVTAFLSGGTRVLAAGAEVSVTGIARLEFSTPVATAVLAQPTRVDLLLRSANDITVIRQPSWWTKQRMFSGLLFAVGIATAAFIWAVTLKRSLTRQTELIAIKMRDRRDAAVEFQAAIRERTRLAANLHDTLLQNMAGLAYQIEACEPIRSSDSSVMQTHLRRARQMVQHCQDDLRNTVWALHCLPLVEGTFAESVEKVVRRIGLGRDTTISVQCSEHFPQLADFIAGNLLLIIQESVQNAVKHSESERIEIELDATPAGDRVSIQVRDQGVGFDVSSRLSSSDGHFGLEGMERRIERLGGTMEIKSQPRIGTVIEVEVPLREFDPKIV